MELAFTIADEQGWNDETLLDLTLGYIENQQNNDAFIDYLRGVQDREASEILTMEDELGL